MSAATPLAKLIGSQLRKWRDAAGLRQDEVARLAREVGLRWTGATVAAIETGRRAVSLPEFIAFPFIGTRFSDHAAPRTLSAFVGRDEPGDQGLSEVVELLPDLLIHRGDISALLEGVSVQQRPTPEQMGPRRGELRIQALFFRGAAATKRIAAGLDPQLDAERKAARRLNVETSAIVSAARRRWGRTLTEERNARVEQEAAPDATKATLQALRGHVTRALVEELAAVLKPAGRRRR